MNSAKYPVNCKQVTNFLRNNTDDKRVELIKGKGYCYFSGGKADSFSEQGVYVNSVRELTFAEWLREYQIKIV